MKDSADLSEIMNYLEKEYEINQGKSIVYYIGNEKVYILFELWYLM